MSALTLALLALSAVGHAAFWIGLVNRWHATGYPRKFVKAVARLFYVGLLVPPALIAWAVYDGRWRPLDSGGFELNWITAYLLFCAAYGAIHVPRWARERTRRQPAEVSLTNSHVVDIARRVGGPPTSGLRAAVFRRIPTNQLLHLHVSEFVVQIPRLPAELDGLSICHLSDLHFSGRIDRPYFHEVVRIANEMDADVLALTGDICDKACYIDWIGETLSPATARLGKFFILGNHDLRTRDVGRLRGAMEEAGFTDLGGRHEELSEHKIFIAGDERPWFKEVPLTSAPQAGTSDRPLRILLAHTPDQLGWARRHDFDLMLAGHTHGGQIRFPIIGPVLCPSWHGTKYSGGFYYEQPTMLHVSRGTASLMPLRINCPPEITKLVLRRGEI